MTSSELLPLLLLLQRTEDALAVSCSAPDDFRREQTVIRLRAMIPAEALEYYSQRRDRRKKAVVPLVNGTCRACNIAVSRTSLHLLRSGDELATCSNCGAFIYLESESLAVALAAMESELPTAESSEAVA